MKFKKYKNIALELFKSSLVFFFSIIIYLVCSYLIELAYADTSFPQFFVKLSGPHDVEFIFICVLMVQFLLLLIFLFDKDAYSANKIVFDSTETGLFVLFYSLAVVFPLVDNMVFMNTLSYRTHYLERPSRLCNGYGSSSIELFGSMNDLITHKYKNSDLNRLSVRNSRRLLYGYKKYFLYYDKRQRWFQTIKEYYRQLRRFLFGKDKSLNWWYYAHIGSAKSPQSVYDDFNFVEYIDLTDEIFYPIPQEEEDLTPKVSFFFEELRYTHSSTLFGERAQLWSYLLSSSNDMYKIVPYLPDNNSSLRFYYPNYFTKLGLPYGDKTYDIFDVELDTYGYIIPDYTDEIFSTYTYYYPFYDTSILDIGIDKLIFSNAKYEYILDGYHNFLTSKKLDNVYPSIDDSVNDFVNTNRGYTYWIYEYAFEMDNFYTKRSHRHLMNRLENAYIKKKQI